MKVVIVGGVAGGASAAARLRRLDESAQITMYERSGYVSYANCGLPYYVGELIIKQEALTLQTPKKFYDRFRIDAKVKHEVIDIDAQNKTVTVKNLMTDEVFVDHYDKLLLAPGAKAVRPNIPGIDHKNIFTLRTVEDALKIHDAIKENDAKSAVVVGGGFVGIEVAENLKHLGMDVTLVEATSQVLSILDRDMVSQVHTQLRENGIQLLLNRKVSCFETDKEQICCVFEDGKKIHTDLVMLAMGVVPDTNLAQKAGLETSVKGSIVVNERMETSVADIYAVGDAVEVTNYVTGKKGLIPLAGPANKQGRIAADNMAGMKSSYKGTQGSSVIQLFDMTIGVTGINEQTAKAEQIDYDRAILSPASHASYYPGGKVMTMKVLFEKETERILGAQIVGFDGVDKRIDVIATAIRSKMKASELAELELCYAPPYSSAKDPVNMAGFIIDNLIHDKVKQFYYEDCIQLPQDGSVFLLDCRTPKEYSNGHAQGFVNIPVDELRERLNEVPQEKPVYVMCQSGLRSYIANRILKEKGYDCYNFAGGYRFYSMVAKDQLNKTESYPCGMDK
ncbi:MAG: FAD-dependent oxidoreductase [Erysipelotrichaceae bacterium]|nr:FAD-dependent oxidoreductase [Erysipelotrichaceae bacterium]